MREKTEVMAGRFTPREKRAIEAQAKKDGLSPSEYVRAAVMTTMVLDGNVEAMKITAKMLRERLKRIVGVEQEPEVATS
jgi:hypothetical protein